jgi:DNA-binding NtrC family response regulator
MTKGKILIVDDDHSIIELLKTTLQESGYSVIAAYNGTQALQKFGVEKPDLILVDYKMPDMTGLDLIRELKKTTPHLKSVLITAFGSEEVAIEAVRQGINDYLKKPFDLEEITKVVEAQLGIKTAQKIETIKEKITSLEKTVTISRKLLQFFHAMGEKNRLKILEMLKRQDMNIMEIVKHFDMSQPTISHHVFILKEAGLIDTYRKGKEKFCKLSKKAIEKYAKDTITRFK